LGDIPILGWLFKSHTSTVQKTNLLVFLTPHIVRQYERVRAILDKKLRERDQFIETNSGGDDLVRNQRDAMIRSLPDINSVTQNPPQGSVTIGDEDSGDGAPKSGNPFTGTAEAPKGAVPNSQANPPSGANPDGSVPNPGTVTPPQGSNNGGIPSAPVVAPPPPTANPAEGG